MFPTTEIKYKTDKTDEQKLLRESAEKIVNQIEELIHQKVNYQIVDSGIEVYIEKQSNEKQNIPIKIINGRLIVPEEFRKYLSEDGKELNYKGEIFEKLKQIEL